MAGMHAGIFGERFKCEKCRDNPKMPDVWGCTKDARMAAPTFAESVNGETRIYRRCPMKFISSSVLKFGAILQYYTKFPNALMPGYFDVSPRFRNAASYYEHHYAEARRDVMKNG